MTFFYDLNKKLDSIREKPEVTHGQLNERDMSRAAKGYEKYGKQGMEALAKAGREGKALDPIRKKYDKYDNTEVDEGIEDRIGDLDMTNPVNQPTYQRKAAAQGGSKKDFPRFSGGKKPADMPKSHEGFPRFSGKGVAADESVIYDIGAGIGGAVKSGAKKALAALNPNKPKKPTYPPLPRGYEGSGQEKADYDKFTGRGDYEESAAMTPKQKKFAALAEPKDKITFADKIAGAKKEVDEMLGDVAAEAMKSALSGGQKKLDKNDNGKLDANDFAMLRKGSGKAPEAKVSRHSTLKKVSNTKTGLSGYVPNDGKEMDEGWDDMMKDAERRRNSPKIGSITHGSKHDVEEIPGGRRVTRRTDPNTGYSVGTDDDAPADGEKRGRGRPKGSKAALGAKGPSGRSKLMTKEGDNESDDIKQAMAMLKKAGYKVTKAADGAEQVDEKAVSKKQQRFMGMVHATQKGEKAPSKEVAKVAKSMGKKDAEDFAATKHKGLPEKKKSDDAPKKKKTEEAGGTGTPTASSGFSYGKGIYDSMNHELESMIAEGMNVSMNMNSDAQGGPSKSLTVTATDDDALKLGALLKNAGLGGGDDHGYGGTGYKSACGCGTPDCSCGDQEMDEAYGDDKVSANAPDYPTDQEQAEDNFGYPGGMHKPKSTGQTTVPVIASQQERQESYAAEEEDAIKRMMEMAGQPASGAGAQVGDMIDYASPSGEQPPEDLIMQNGVEYDPDTNVISVRNATSLADTHRAITAAGWKKQTAGARPNPAAAGQAQRVGDVPYQLGEEDDLARMMEMAGMKQNEVLDEGVMDKLKSFAVPKLMKLLGPDAEKIASAVKQATGGDLTPSKENAMKVVQALGIDKAATQGQSPQMAEGIAGNWQGKLIQSLYTLGLLGSAGAAASMYGTVGGSFMGVVGVLLLMFANTFFGDAPGQVGVYGKFGNKGTSAQRGLDDHGMPVRNMNVDEDDLNRMMEMAGVKKKEVDEEKTEEGNKFTGNLAKARAAGKKEADLDGDGTMEKVDEGILAATANLWKQYKGQYGV